MSWRRVVMVVVATFVATGCGKDTSPKTVCKHIVKIVKMGDSSEALDDCLSSVQEMKKRHGDDVYKQVAECALKAKTERDLDHCDPESIKAGKSGSRENPRTREAREFVKKIYDGARAHYMDPPVGDSFVPVEPHFPKVSVGPTPPLGACCSNGGRCTPDQSLWTHETWTALMFSADDPHYYSYQYIAKDSGQAFTARAMGDLDCDGQYSTFEMYGSIDKDDPHGQIGTAEMFRKDENE